MALCFWCVNVNYGRCALKRWWSETEIFGRIDVTINFGACRLKSDAIFTDHAFFLFLLCLSMRIFVVVESQAD